MLIVFEGIDYLGKTTMLDKLMTTKLDFIKTKEPGSVHTSIGKAVREIVLNNSNISAFTRELLFYADANAHRQWKEELPQSQLVLSDRGLWSHLAYLYGCLKTKQVDWDEYFICKKIIAQACAKPDAIIYFQGSIELMKERSNNREKDAIETMGDSFYTWVLTAYDDLVNSKQYQTLVLDAKQSIDINQKLCEDFIHEVSGGIS